MARQRILIIGGGMAGVSLGSELAVDHDVVLLEAESSLAVHSTGRSAALFLADYGPPPVRELTRRSEPEFARLSALPDVPPLLTPRGGLFTTWDEPSAAALTAAVASSPSMVAVTADRVRELCPVLRTDELAGCAFDADVRDIDVAALHGHYAGTLRRRGGRITTGARVVAADRVGAGWEVRTADGRTWHADALVNAAGAWGDQVAELCAGVGHRLSPRRRTVAIARSRVPIPAQWPVVADFAEAWYFKPESGALLLSPGDETEVPPGDVESDPLDVALVLERVNAATTLDLRSVRTSWAGLRTFAPDRAPVVGPHPEEPTLFSFVGQGGYGIQMAPALAGVGARLFRTGTLDDAVLAAAIDPGRARTALDR
ncbi:NAD(P)/FAD-dependent oxidoreductase [Umezawaea endophytica]|uniref:FAD-binding oxidoreductase n=1 Tax=Umezawaea endophytica TaxID=1654476 RepID=A0A9X2VGK0_9PSEU|nr:FAD-dependent oxidoreductase [Umezawaea endophytica]MCS7475717.1 FAD-binding oxidoreductase [Umezawaea endophytica]